MNTNVIRIVFLLFISVFINDITYGDVFPQDSKFFKSEVNDSTKIKKENLSFHFTQSKLHQLGDYDLARWLTHLPHTWVTRSPQFGQPQAFQGIGTPIWMSEISWNGMELVDPIYGNFDLNFLPVVPIDTLRTKNPIQSSLEIIDEKVSTTRPYSQVFYNAGGNELKNVDILFRRGFSKGILFKAGANFFKYGGIYFNSKYDIFKQNSEIFIPLSNKLNLTYKYLSNRIESGYPGAIDQNYTVQFNRLHRKVLRQDHGIDLDYFFSDRWQGKMQFQYHQDKREYTDWKLPWHSVDKQRWADLSTRITRISNSSTSNFGVTAQALYTSRLNEERLKEFPIKLFLSHHQKTVFNSEIKAKISYSKYNSDWHGYLGELGFSKKLNEKIKIITSGYYKQQVLPFGWRNGRILPFENQLWPIIFTGSDFNFYTETRPESPVTISGIRLRIKWRPTAKIEIYSDVQFQQIKNLSFPQTGVSGNIEFKNIPKYHSTGFFLNTKFHMTDWLTFTGRYQNSTFSSQEFPNAIEVPKHWIFAQLHASRFFFQNNLKANILLFSELISERNSYNLTFSESSVYLDFFEAVPLFHLKLTFEIGKTEIFLHWNNLSDQLYYFRSQQPIPGWQFQYGVIWRFWD